MIKENGGGAPATRTGRNASNATIPTNSDGADNFGVIQTASVRRNVKRLVQSVPS